MKTSQNSFATTIAAQIGPAPTRVIPANNHWLFPTLGRNCKLAGLACLFTTILCSLFCINVAAQTVAVPDTNSPPLNVLMLLVDDLGAHDLSCTGSDFYQTPALDQLADRSLHFRQAYASASVCSPSRAGLMTGIHPVRISITDWIPGNPGTGRMLKAPEDLSELPLHYETMGEAFGQSGYRTYYAGKWHLGGKGFSPSEQGFQTYFDPHKDSSKGQPANHPVGDDRPHATRTMTDHLIQFLQQDNPRPFFAILSYYDVHTPIVPDQRFLSEYQRAASSRPKPLPIAEHDGKSRPQQDSAPYASMISAVDESAKRIWATLEQRKLDQNTIVIFTSDNGGLCTLKQPGPTCNLPLRAGKGWLYEGGIRVPLLVYHPRHAARTLSLPVTQLDLFPTLRQWCHLPQKKTSDDSDGQSLQRTLTKSPQHDRTFVWHYPHYHGSTWTPGSAIRHGKWKMIHFAESDVRELYDLENDPGELQNIAHIHPEVVEKLTRELSDWKIKTGAKDATRQP